MEQEFLKFVSGVMEVEPSDISMETEYINFKEWDSLMMLTLVMELEAEFGVSIPVERLGNVKTLADLYAFVK